MKKVLIFEYLPLLKKKEILELEEWGTLSRFKLIEKERDFLKYIISFHPNYQQTGLEKASVLEQLSWKEEDWKQAMAKIRKLVRSYISFLGLEFNPTEILEKQGDFFKARASMKNAVYAYEKALDLSNSDVHKGSLYYLDQFLLHLRLYETKSYFSNDPMDCGFAEMVDKLDCFYILSKLWMGCESEGMKGYKSKYAEIWKSEEALKYAEEMQVVERNPLFSIYANIKRLWDNLHLEDSDLNENYELFLWTKKSFKDNHQLIDDEKEGKQLFISLHNYCINRSRKGEHIYDKQKLDIVEFGVSSKFILTHGKVSEIYFQNMILAAAALKYFDKANQLLNDYIDLVDFKTMDKKGLVAFCKAFIYYEQKNYEEALVNINRVPYTISLRNIIVKGLEIRCSYELYMSDPVNTSFLLNRITNFNRYLRKDQSLSTALKESCLNFIKLLNKILWAQIKLKWAPKKKQELLDELNAYQSIALKDWLVSIIHR